MMKLDISFSDNLEAEIKEMKFNKKYKWMILKFDVTGSILGIEKKDNTPFANFLEALPKDRPR